MRYFEYRKDILGIYPLSGNAVNSKPECLLGESMNDQKAPAEAAKTSLEIVDTLIRLNGAGVSKLAECLDKPTSTIHDHLQTLTCEEYLINENGTYRVGSRFLEFGEQVRSRMRVYQVARPEIDNLVERTNETVNLMIEEHGQGVYL